MAYDLKDEQEVKQYLENLGIEYRFSCFHEKNSEGCHLLGDYLEAVKKDLQKAIAVYKSNCDERNYGRSCYKYATYRYLGKYCEKNANVALQYFEKGCLNESAQACLLAGAINIAEDVQNIRKDLAKGLKFFSKGCELNNAEACHRLSGLYITGGENIPKDMKKAFVHALKSCELGNKQACANVSQMYRRGDGVERDDGLSSKFRSKTMEMHRQETENMNQLKFGE